MTSVWRSSVIASSFRRCIHEARARGGESEASSNGSMEFAYVTRRVEKKSMRSRYTVQLEERLLLFRRLGEINRQYDPFQRRENDPLPLSKTLNIDDPFRIFCTDSECTIYQVYSFAFQQRQIRENVAFAVNALAERFIKRRCRSLKRDASRREGAMPIFGIDQPDTLSFVGKYGQKLRLEQRTWSRLSSACLRFIERRENLDKNIKKMWIKILLIEEPLIK